jgi:hypothetical protein
MAHAWKVCWVYSPRGFESLSLRHFAYEINIFASFIAWVYCLFNIMSNFNSSLSLIEEAQAFQSFHIDKPFESRIALAEFALKSLGSQGILSGEIGGTFLFDARSAFCRPIQYKGEGPRVIRFDDIAVEGRLRDFSYLTIGRLGSSVVSSLCADLEEVTMLPDGDLLPEGDISSYTRTCS